MDQRIGAQFYTIRKNLETIEGFEDACRKVSEIGYKIIQISGTPLPAKEMREVCDKYGLEVVTSHKGFSDFENNIDEVIEYNKTLGCKLCGVGSMPTEYAESNEKVSEFIKKSSKIADDLKKEGMLFGYHNHSFEFIKYDGKRIIDRLIEETDPEIYNFIVDTYWIQVGGCVPQEYIEILGKRAMAVHFKDLKMQLKEFWCPRIAEVGNGNLDWDKIIKACETAGTKWALVEQDSCEGDPFDSLKISYDYLIQKGFK